MKRHILTLSSLILLTGCSSAIAPKALQSPPAAPVAKAKASLPNAHDAANHDRLMMTTIKDNALVEFPGLWEANFGDVFRGLSIGQCIDLLDSIGAQAVLSDGLSGTDPQPPAQVSVSSDGLSGADPQTPAQVSSWCRGASKDGLIAELTLFYTPNVPYEFLKVAVHPANSERHHSGS